MIGNDVVDLFAAAQESNWRRKGFLEKVFSEHEQEQISNSRDPHQMVWLLWSMKEAAYKAHQRRFELPRKLNWKSQVCFLDQITSEKASGIVKIGNCGYSCASEITEAYVHTSAVKLQEKGSKNVIFEAPSAEIKKDLLQKIAAHFSVPSEYLVLQKNEAGVPHISFKNDIFFQHFSLSDHGRFSAYSLSLTNC